MPPTCISYVESKRCHFGRIEALLAESEDQNHWTNFGPVWRRLKSFIETRLALPPSRSALPCASGNSALFAAAAIAPRTIAKPWVVSAYGFRSTVIGPFAQAMVVDCDANGLLPTDFHSALAADSFGGFVVTNPFGLFSDFSAYVGLARALSKPLILDNAAGFLSIDRTDHAGIFECLSFHHTKPFGFGEGGCLILDRALEEQAIAALNFGYGARGAADAVALSNGKLSDVAAAFILDRLERESEWAPSYLVQARRVTEIVDKLGLRQLKAPGLMGEAAVGCLAVLIGRELTTEALANPYLTLRKYYPPLSDDAPNARAIYNQIINIPVHSGLALVSDDEIGTTLRKFLTAGARVA